MNASPSSESSREGERALAELGPKLAALAEAAVVRPSTDPHGAAATALLVSDYLGQADFRGKLGGAGTSPEGVLELRALARAIICVVMQLGGDYLPDSPSIPGDLVQRGQTIRTTIASALEKALPDDQELQIWLEAIRLGSGVVDLVYDLRTLADLCVQHGNSSAATKATAGAVQTALSAADAVEFALRTGDSAEIAQARHTLARLWTLFVPAYDQAAVAARALAAREGQDRQFPALALVASHRRARRRPVSLMPAHATPPRRSTAPRRSRAPSVAPLTAAEARSAPKIPASPGVPQFDDVELIEADDIVGADILRSDAPAAPNADREAWSNTRIAARHTLEIEVGIASESNFYLGFTENLSAGGVFVATYVSKPLGSHVEVALAFPSGEQLRVPGVVRWLREGTTDGWPGMGVQFESLSSEDEAKIRKFLSLREPMFYDV